MTKTPPTHARLAWLRRLPSLLHPPFGRCALCGEAGGALAVCAACRERHLQPRTGRCPCCALPGTGGLRCGGCQSAAPAYDETVAACDYAPPLDQLVQALKFRACLALAPAFARQMAAAWRERDARAVPPAPPLAPLSPAPSPPLLLPVPLSRQRLAERGFNQALEIARPLARELALPLAPALCERVRDAAPQSSLPLAQRRVNMRGAFALARGASVRGRDVIVVDDVMTTGHTLAELAALLKRHGAARVVNLVFARTPPPAPA